MKTYAHGKNSVIAALLGNAFVTVIKTAAFFITGSVSMFAESVHSLADTLNQSLLLVGIQRSKKPADGIHGYGYGIERFFWSLISACGVLFIGSGITLYHSIYSLIYMAGGVPVFSKISIPVLILAFIIEGVTFWLAVKELKENKKISVQMFKEADPILLAIIYEDGIAVLSVIFALIAQWLTYATGNIIYDAVGGIAIGLMLGFLAILLIIKNHQYIIGKPLGEEVIEEIIEELEKDPCIEHVVEFKSVAVDINKYRIFATVEWNGSPLYEEIYEAGDLKQEFNSIKNSFAEFTKLMFKTTDRIPRLVGNRIDVIEKDIVEKFPQIAYVDIEIN
ncbi:MAG TPA: cation diffusion facilitator family transporter [Candidatus Paceibacterota bacterium]|jgi:zinc transporter 9|nr:cation diffusion facilitator family transporter [Candidatus Paceibacterota bacterium]